MNPKTVARLGAQRIADNRKRQADRRADIAAKLADYDRLRQECIELRARVAELENR